MGCYTKGGGGTRVGGFIYVPWRNLRMLEVLFSWSPANLDEEEIASVPVLQTIFQANKR